MDRKGRVQLGEPLDGMLCDFCEAHYGAPAIRVIRDAVQAFIDARLADEPAMRARYEAVRKQRLSGKNTKVTAIKGNN